MQDPGFIAKGPTHAQLIAAAKALDADNVAEARDVLRSLPLALPDPATRLVALAIWKRVVLHDLSAGELAEEAAATAMQALGSVGRAVGNAARIRELYAAIPSLEKTIGAVDTAAVVAAILWQRIEAGPEGLFVAAFELFFRGGDMPRCQLAWNLYLAAARNYVPSYWIFLLYRRTFAADVDQMQRAVAQSLTEANRDDLLGLMGVYNMQAQQLPPRQICAAAVALPVPQRQRIIEYMTGIGYASADIGEAVACAERVAAGTGMSGEPLAYMRARLANAEGRWSDAIEFASEAERAPELRLSAQLLTAHAVARMGRISEARARIATVEGEKGFPPFLQARAAFLRVTVTQLERHMPTPENAPQPVFRQTPGRPLAQSLWVGQKLRWIERLAIRSYLDNGWRFQLYVYDDVENVPEGCELLDANVILHRNEVFSEGFSSGLHAGSVGAFSDLFRYRLLYLRGGMWTDTDVINLRKFDPDGRGFVSSEVTDAGLVTLNGAIMAAPARSRFLERAYERSLEILHSDELVFTRIGPHLIAELMEEIGLPGMEVMPPNFLSAISWMNTATLLDPHDGVAAFLKDSGAMNLHVYTEMWRTLGLGLDKPPQEDSFLGCLYAETFKDRHAAASEVMS